MSGQPVHVAVSLPVSGAAVTAGARSHVLDAARMAERAGFDAVCVGDHIIHPLPMLESLVTLAVVAGHTERIGIEVSVLQLALRQSAVVTKQLASLACLAPRRLAAGIGVGGEHEAEWAACGMHRETRGRDTTAAARDLIEAMAGRPARFADDRPHRIEPAPAAEVPLFFGGRRPGALARAATLGSGWVGWLHSPRGFARVRETLAGLRGEAGASGPFWYGMQVPVAIHDSHVAGRTLRWPNGSDGYSVEGSPRAVVDQLRAYWEVGCDRFKLTLVDTANAERQLELVATDVLPALRQWQRG